MRMDALMKDYRVIHIDSMAVVAEVMGVVPNFRETCRGDHGGLDQVVTDLDDPCLDLGGEG